MEAQKGQGPRGLEYSVSWPVEDSSEGSAAESRGPLSQGIVIAQGRGPRLRPSAWSKEGQRMGGKTLAQISTLLPNNLVGVVRQVTLSPLSLVSASAKYVWWYIFHRVYVRGKKPTGKFVISSFWRYTYLSSWQQMIQLEQCGRKQDGHCHCSHWFQNFSSFLSPTFFFF